MNDKKNIDRLFQEKLKDFEVTPNISVWENIKRNIHPNKKHRKVIPLWWKIAGVAASLLLIITIGSYLLINDKNNFDGNVVNTDSKNTIENNSIEDEKTTQEITPENKSVVVEGPTDKSFLNSDETLNTNSSNSRQIKKDKNSILISNNSVDEQKNNRSFKNNSVRQLLEHNKDKIARNTISSKNIDKLSIAKKNNSSVIDDKEQINSSINNYNKIKQKTEFTNLTKKTETKAKITETSIENNKKLSLTEELASTNEKIEDKDQLNKINRWSVNPNIAPVYFNSLGTGSSINSQFNNNSKTGDINISYGISGSYVINTKLSVRTGINKVSLGYSTNDIVVYNNIQTITNNPLLRNIAFNDQSQNVSFVSINDFNFAQVPNIISDRINASIDQKLGFLEIPIEIQYNISNKKLGINAIAGVSALFLTDNEIFSVQDGQTSLLGKATNVNNTSYSANFGFGFDFKISKTFNFNLEPVFKYQINTFNDTSGNFRPYFIGVYSGLKFKF
jgi:hypothetical protein